MIKELGNLLFIEHTKTNLVPAETMRLEITLQVIGDQELAGI